MVLIDGVSQDQGRSCKASKDNLRDFEKNETLQ